MDEPEDFQDENPRFTVKDLIRWGVIVFTAITYLYIFVKILFVP